MTTALKRTGAALLTLLMFCVLTLGASAAANTPVGVKFWKEKSDKESMANSGIDSDREATLTRQSNGTYTLTLPVKQVTKLNVTGYLSGLTIGDVTYTGTLTGDIEKGNGSADRQRGGQSADRDLQYPDGSEPAGRDQHHRPDVHLGKISRTITKSAVPPGTALFAVQQSMCFSTKSVAILSSCITAFSAPFITLRTLRRIWRLLWVAIMAPAAPRAAPAAMPTTMPAAEFSRCFILNFSFRPVMTGLAVLLFPQKNLVCAFFMQQFVVYCCMMLFIGRCARLFGKEVFLFAKTR